MRKGEAGIYPRNARSNRRRESAQPRQRLVSIDDIKRIPFHQTTNELPALHKDGFPNVTKLLARETVTPLFDPLDNFHFRVVLCQPAGQDMNIMSFVRQPGALLVQYPFSTASDQVYGDVSN